MEPQRIWLDALHIDVWWNGGEVQYHLIENDRDQIGTAGFHMNRDSSKDHPDVLPRDVRAAVLNSAKDLLKRHQKDLLIRAANATEALDNIYRREQDQS